MKDDAGLEAGLAEIADYDPVAWEKRIPANCLVNRNGTLLELSRGKRVLHLGAAKYPFHREAAINKGLLHQQIGLVAKELVGIEQNAEAIDYLRTHHGIDNIVHADTTANAEITDDSLKDTFDVVLCCDIIEHVDNPGSLIDFCRKFMSTNTLLVITTINAGSLKNAMRALLGREAVHHDHVAYYSYSTLCQLIYRHGLVPVSAGFFSYGTRLRIAGMFFNILASLRPGSADGILITCKMQQ